MPNSKPDMNGMNRDELLQHMERMFTELREEIQASIHSAAEAKTIAMETKSSVQDLLEVFVTIRGGVKFFTATVTILRWLVGAGLVLGALVAALQMLRSGVISIKFPPE